VTSGREVVTKRQDQAAILEEATLFVAQVGSISCMSTLLVAEVVGCCCSGTEKPHCCSHVLFVVVFCALTHLEIKQTMPVTAHCQRDFQVTVAHSILGMMASYVAFS
jgi:hypothetical protein